MEDKSFKPSNLKPFTLFLVFIVIYMLASNFLTIHLDVIVIVALMAEGLTQLGINYYKITLIGHSMRCYDVWGKFYLIDLESIEDIKPANFLGLKYLKIVSTKASHTLWLPMYLKNLQDFAEEIKKRASEDNPLNIYLSQHPVH